MLFDFASILMQDRMVEEEKTEEEAILMPQQQQGTRKGSGLIVLPHLTCILCMIILMGIVLVLLSTSKKARMVVPGGGGGCSMRRMVMETFAVPFFCTLIACTCFLWIASIAVSQFLDYNLAVCLSMHSSIMVLGFAMEVLYSFPFSTMFMPLQLLAGTVASEAALLLLIICHYNHEQLPFTLEELYRNHAASALFICPIMKQTLLRVVMAFIHC